jgi:hypothetical protein
MQQPTFSLQENCGVYFLYDGNEKVVTPNGSELWTKSQKLAKQMLAEAVEAGLRWNDWRTVICFQSRYCDYAADPERLSRDTEMLEETLYDDDFWGFDEPMRNRAAVVSAYKQRLLGTIQNLPLNDRVIFLTTAEMLNTILLPHKIISAFFFEDSLYDITNINDVDDFIKELDDYCRDIGLTFNLKKKERLAIWKKLVDTIEILIVTQQ